MSDRIDLAAIRARVAEVGMAECARCHTPTHINDIVGGDLCIGCDTDDANASVLEGLRLCVQCEDTEAEFASSLCIDCSEGFASDLDTCDECGHNPRQCDAFETDNALLKQMVDKLRTENVLMREIIAVCMSQVRMLEAAGAHEQAKGAQLCADVLGLLTPLPDSAAEELSRLRAAAFQAVAVVVPIRPGGPFAAIRTRRGIELPGGKVEPGETTLAAARREAREELGVPLTDRPLVPLGEFLHVFEGRLWNCCAFVGDLGGAHPGKGDCGETTWATREELLAGPYGPVVARIFGVLDAVPPGGAP